MPNATIRLLGLATEPNSPSPGEEGVPGVPNLGLSLEIVKVVEQIMYCLDGLISLHALMTVYSQARRNYQEGTEAALFAAIRSFAMAPQFQRILCLRHSASANSAPPAFSIPISRTIQSHLLLIHVHVYSRNDLWH